ncbi:hypothetical protein ACSVH2_07225 [Flavobacterium sp. RSB2_4_14]|uniref:hypothetical protein n=1 Tax=Flavobacterium sp. RSB2_4_14 TaxID=3447665 RepID=UPI003F2CDBD9
MSNTTQSPDLSIVTQGKYKQIDLILEWKTEFSIRMKLLSKSTKQTFTFTDAVNKTDFHTKRDLCFLETFRFLNKNPLQNNDYVKYVSCYIKEGRKLDLKYFRNNIEKLNDYYTKVDETKAKGINYNPFNLVSYRNYVLYMVLKLRGEYIKSDDILFNVEYIDNREYNPLSKTPSVMRGELPFKVKEYDIKRAYPTFIDIELNTNHRSTIYDKIDKRTFAILLNSNRENPKNKIDSLRNQLSVVYGNDAKKVLTDERFNKKGKAFLDFSSYEKKYINQFVKKNELVNYVRLHDGVFVLNDIDCKNLNFDIVEFAIKECIKPPIENETINFYSFDGFGEVVTSRVMYANFFVQEKFKRISTPDDKIQLLVDTNNVIDFFNHKTDIVSFLESNINECKHETELVRETIARECNSLIYQSYTLIPPTELKYYSDTKNSFGLPFKNGFFYFDDDTFKIKRKEYSEVNGFFSPHKIQTREFEYTKEIGMFQEFLTRAVLNADNDTIVNENDDTKFRTLLEFGKMIGYLCHSHKSQINNPCIILTDENANDENRNGRRGKTLIYKAINEVTTTMLKGGNEFDAGYTHVFADLQRKHKVYAIDDVPAGFKYDDLYTNILGAINCQRKGLTAELIPFEETPKFMITSNWVVRYDEKNASTNKRFLEYKFTNYYNQHHSPKDDFNCEFFTDWDVKEWNRFYSFIFNCVSIYLQFGIKQISYDKTRDNYLVAFDNNSMSEEFERIINDLINLRDSFSVNDFLKIYQEYDNPMRNERFFHSKNVKKLIETWFLEQIRQGKSLEWSYSIGKRRWIK